MRNPDRLPNHRLPNLQIDRVLPRAPVAQLDRALASGAKGRGFESPRAHQPSDTQITGFLEVPAELIIEVLSDDTSWSGMETKIGEYHTAGVDLVWVLDPRTLSLRECDTEKLACNGRRDPVDHRARSTVAATVPDELV